MNVLVHRVYTETVLILPTATRAVVSLDIQGSIVRQVCQTHCINHDVFNSLNNKTSLMNLGKLY